jgi:hypothetical protein
MAVTYTNRDELFRGKYTMYLVDITFDSSYATAGEAIAAADFGFAMIRGIWPAHAEGFNVEAVRSSDSAWLLKGYAYSGSTNTAIEWASGLDRSSITVPCLVLGR